VAGHDLQPGGGQHWCRPTALVSAGVSAGSSVVAIAAHSVKAAILLAVLSCISITAACVTRVLESWNRDTAIIDARTRAKSLRRWARKAATPEERERAARAALAPMVLSGESPSESLQNVLPPKTGNGPGQQPGA
jgi:hypothetical protein